MKSLLIVVALVSLIGGALVWILNAGQAAATRTDQLADLRHSGLKLYYEWWEACFVDGKPKPRTDEAYIIAGVHAEDWRLRVHALLEKSYGRAVAIEFNTPRMQEPSPPNRSLAQCPVNVEIVQHGYRLDRLGDILIRERGRR